MYAIAIVILGGLALYGFLKWLDRVHPVIVVVDNADSVKHLEAKIQEFREELDEIKLGRSLRQQED